MFLIQNMANAEACLVQSRLAANGAAPVLVHPFYFGVTAKERTQTIAVIEAGTKGSTEGLAEGILRDQDVYMTGVRKAVNHRSFNGVGFVFQTEHQMEHLPYLHSLNRGMAWVIIRTQRRNPVPKDGTWAGVLLRMKDLGLREAYVGGCYATVNDSNELLPTADVNNYACVNKVVEEMRGPSVRFDAVHVALGFTYVSLPPPV